MLAVAIQGAVRPSATLQWLLGDDTPLDLSGATLSGTISSLQSDSVRPVAGELVVLDGQQGLFEWRYAAADVVNAGVFSVQFTAAFADNPSPARTLATPWTVSPAA